MADLAVSSLVRFPSILGALLIALGKVFIILTNTGTTIFEPIIQYSVGVTLIGFALSPLIEK